MKHPKIITLLLFAALLLGLCACGSESTGAPSPEPEASAASEITSVPAAEPMAAPEPSAEPEPEPSTGPEPEPEFDAKAAAEALVGADVSELYEAIGYPVSSSYAPSCLGDGEDGELVYDGFTVYTFKAASGAETVNVVL
ncbi:MAG: hypothetical protein NC319_04650 [Butyricicoccus sp.]|nr:hypothetical protein [Butyricicoccus sp.]